MIDLTGLNYDADAAARVALARCACGLALRPLPDQAQGQAEADLKSRDHRRRGCGCGEAAGTDRWQPVLDGVAFTRELVTEPANIIYPETLRRALFRAR